MATGPAPGARLRTIAWGAVALAAVTAAEQAGRFVRAFDSVNRPMYDYLPLWERFFVDPPSVAGPLVGLAAVVLILLLPVAPRFDRGRTAVTWLVGAASAANLVAALVYAWMAHQGRDGIVFGSLLGIIVDYLPGYGVSAVLLFLVVNTRRWRQGDVAEARWGG